MGGIYMSIAVIKKIKKANAIMVTWIDKDG